MADGEAIVGAKVEVYNPDDDLWATGRIERYYPDKGWLVQYYDGDSAWVSSLENVQIMERPDDDGELEEEEEEEGKEGEDNGGAVNKFEEKAEAKEEALLPMATVDQSELLRELMGGSDGHDSDMNEFDEYLLSHPHGDDTLRELAGLGRNATAHTLQHGDDGDAAENDDDDEEDEDMEHMPSEENNAVIEINISEITDLVTRASDIRNPQIRILFADTPREQQVVDSTFRCKSLLFTSGVGVTVDTNALEWKTDGSNSRFTFEAIMQDGPIEEALFGDLILALHGDTPVGHQQMVAEACIHLKDVLRNGESKIGASLAKISINTAAPMKQRLNRKVTDGVVHFEINIYFRRARLLMQHRAPALEPPKPRNPQKATANGATRDRRSTHITSAMTKKQPPHQHQKLDHAALRRNSAIAKRQREQAALKQQNERHLAKINNTRSHVAKLLGTSTKLSSNSSRRLSRNNGAQPARPSSRPVVLDESVKAAFNDQAALAACIVELRRAIAELEESSRQSRVKLQKQEALMSKRRKQIAASSGRSSVPPAASIGSSNTFSQLDLGSLAQDDLELQELKATNDAFTATQRQLAEQIETDKRRYETASRTYDQRVSQLRLAKRRIKRMMERKQRGEANGLNDDLDSGSDDESTFLRLHQQHITLQAEIEALSQFREVTDRGPDHELDTMKATASRLEQQVAVARQRLEEAQRTLQMYRAKSEEYTTSQLYERWRKCVAAMRAITTKCDREERLHAVVKQIEDVDPGYRQAAASWRT